MAPRSPKSAQDALAFLTRQPFAHRGLHDARANIVENSLAAFDRAIEAGHGIELDVQLCFDGDVVVFHDATLDRLTDRTGVVSRLSRSELEKIKLKGTDETIHTLHAVLMHIRGRVPVLIEAKTPSASYLPICFAVRRALEGYRGALAVMSFNPNVTGWFARHAARVPHGLVVSDETRHQGPLGMRRKLERLLSVWRAQPQFLAYDVRSLPSPLTTAFRARNLPVLTWTVRSASDRKRAEAYADQMIYEVDRSSPADEPAGD